MSHSDIRAFIADLEKSNDIIRVKEEVDPDQEITVIQDYFVKNGGPALLFENVKNSSYRMAANLFGNTGRINKVFGRDPAEAGEKLVELAKNAMPPSFSRLWAMRKDISRLVNSRFKITRSGSVLEKISEPANLNSLPVLTCWPLDGGPFFTLPLVHTVDPVTGAGNTGIYRMQRYDDASTGMHWQIEKGGGFHFKKACELGRPLNVSVILGGPPALTLAAITALPEGVDERLLACWIMGKPLSVLKRKGSGHLVPSNAEFVLEGTVTPGDMKKEGPFGDHFGHYSHSADFPVFRVSRVLARKDAIYPATIVGKPPQEDYYIGMALQKMTLPLLKYMYPGINDLWAYPETGFHPLAVASVKERYPKEALKHAFSILGLSQLSLTKVLIVTNGSCKDVKDIREVSRVLWRNLNEREGLHLIAPSAQDTLDFTGPAMNSGSRLILIATDNKNVKDRDVPPPPAEPAAVINGTTVKLANIGESFLIVQVRKGFDLKAIQEYLNTHPVYKRYLFHILISDDVPLDDNRMILWSWFTRFDPLLDMHAKANEVSGNRMIFKFPVMINATWKEGYPKPLEYDEKVEKKAKLILGKILNGQHN